jgi:anti-sigma regulatory factor (Ser/Thr protein kinase)
MAKKTSEEIRSFILNNVRTNPTDISKLTAENFNISRTAVNRHISILVNEGLLKKEGTTKDIKHSLNNLVEEFITIPLAGIINEDLIWRERIRPILKDIPENVIRLFNYGFTEMMNNAIDHSDGTEAKIGVIINPVDIILYISDNGVGIFNKIKEKLNLDDHRHAILELAKGKLTTDPDTHTGEGIFFSSRMFDNFTILSSFHFFSHREPDNDWLLESKEKHNNGTFISMQTSKATTRTTYEVHNKYETHPESYTFNRTHVPVNLLIYGDENLVSRSQAKRLLARLDKFKEVFLDFAGVESIGPAFADEIFRVFKNKNPNITLRCANANDDVMGRIRRALNNS